MKMFLRFMLFCVLAVVTLTSLHAGDAARARGEHTAASHPAPRYLAGTVIIKLKRTTPNIRGGVWFRVPALDDAAGRIGLTGRRSLFPMAPYPENRALSSETLPDNMQGFDRVYVLSYRESVDAREAARQLAATGLVEFAEPYFIFETCYTPNDPLITQQTWLTNIQAQQAWNITKGDSTITIAIVDTGLQWMHEDLAGNVWTNPGESGTDNLGHDKRTNGRDDDNNGFIDDFHGWDFVGNTTLAQLQVAQYLPDNDPSPRPNSIQGYEGYHGTFVGGCASARGDNAKGVVGVGFSTKLVGVKCAADSEGTNSVVAGYDGIRYAADIGARVINCSWGGQIDASQTQGLQTVINYTYTKGSLVVAAAGNSGTNNDVAPSFPANLQHVLSVGATDSRDSAASFSEYGISVGVWAPGVGIYTTQLGNTYGGTNVDGTSFASPITAGVAALVFARHPTWTPDQVAMQLRVTGDRVKVRIPDYAPYFYRRVNAFRAVSLNSTLAAGDPTGMPGVAITGYSINGQASDTLRDVTQSVAVELHLQNYLAPVTNLKIESVAGQALTIGAPVVVPTIGSMETATQNLNVTVSPSSGILYSEGNLQLVLKVTSGSYEDYLTVQIPVRLPGWHQQIDRFSAGAFAPWVGNGIHAVTPKIAWTVSDVATSQTTETPLIARTTSGDSWTAFQQVSTSQESFYCITARDAQKAWAGTGPSTGQANIFRSTNGGGSWQKVNVSSITPFVNSVHMFDDLNGIFNGDPKSNVWGIGVTTNGGASWQPIASPLQAGSSTEAGWNNSMAVYGNNVWFGTNNTRIYHSSDRGATWTFSNTPSKNSFSISFGNAKDGVASFAPVSTGGGNYALAATRDGGTSWRTMPLPFTNAQPSGVSFVPNTTRVFVATQNGMYETSDFGVTWKQMAVPPFVFQSIILSTAVDSTSGQISSFGTSAYTQIMTYKDSMPPVVSGVGPDGPITSTLAATHLMSTPNPCSLTTRVSFDIDAAAATTLELYDALGLRVATVFTDKPLEAGHYDIPVAMDNLSSGTYYMLLTNTSGRSTSPVVVVR